MIIPQISIIDIINFERHNFNFKTENKFCYVLSCRIDGESLFFFDNKEHLLKRGDILYIPSQSSYSQESDYEKLICFHLNIHGRISPNIEISTPRDKEKICELFSRAEQLWKNRPQNYELLCMSILYEILSNTHVCENEQIQNTAALLQLAVSYIDTHIYDTNFSLEEACKEVHISRTYFNKLFRQTYECTPSAYVNKKRIERSKHLLASGNLSNDEIACLCGFNDVKYFYVVFKKLTGLTTKEYKQEFESYHSKYFVADKQ